MPKVKLFTIIALLNLGFYNSNAQLIGRNKLKKYLLASFKVLQTKDLPNIGTLYEAKIYFKDDTTRNKVIFIMEHSSNSEFIVGELTKNDGVDLFENQKDDQYLNYIKVSSSEITFLKSPWKDLGLTKGFLQFTSVDDNPRRCLIYLYLNLPDPYSIRITGYVEDDLKELNN